jgi:hypothetical protein
MREGEQMEISIEKLGSQDRQEQNRSVTGNSDCGLSAGG